MKKTQIKQILSKESQRTISGGLFAPPPGGGNYTWSCSVELTDGTLHSVTVTTCDNNVQDARVEARKGYSNVFNTTCTASAGVPAS